jgi:hypothetical protein
MTDREALEQAKADAQAIYEWLREPDFAEFFGNKELANWLNRRPSGKAKRLSTYALTALASQEGAQAGEVVLTDIQAGINEGVRLTLSMIRATYGPDHEAAVRETLATARITAPSAPDEAVGVAVEAEREACAQIAHDEAMRCKVEGKKYRPTSVGGTGALCMEVGGEASATAIETLIRARKGGGA